MSGEVPWNCKVLHHTILNAVTLVHIFIGYATMCTSV